MAINTGVDTSKFVGYAVLAINPGVDASKFGGYAVQALNIGVDTIKFGGYAVLSSVDVSPPSWPTVFPNGTVSIAYSFTINVSGALPITVNTTPISGSVPPGLSLAATGNAVTLSGTPTTAGTYNFTLRATNANGTADQPFTVLISSGKTPFTYIVA